MKDVFSDGDAVDARFVVIAGAILDAALNAARRPAGPEDTRVHDVRRQMKKLRALMRLARPGFADFARENAAARDAARLLSEVRDEAVLETTLHTLLETVPSAAGRELAATLGGSGPDAEATEAALVAFAEAATPIRQRLQGWTLHPADPGVLVRGIGRTWRKARAALRRAEKLRTATALHEWRKQVKYLRTEARMLRGLHLHGLPASKTLKGLADALGRHHDLDVLVQFLAARLEASLYDALVAEARRQQHAIEAQVFEGGATLFAEKPRHWRKRLHAQLPARHGRS